MKKTGSIVLKAVLTAIVLFFVGRQVVDHWHEIAGFQWQVQFGWLGLSILFGLTALFVFSLCWRSVIAAFGHTVKAPVAFKISYLANLGRYVPGKVWQVFGMLYLAGKEDIKPTEAGASFVITQLFAIPASLLLFAVAARLEPSLIIDRIAFLGGGAALTLVLVMVAACAALVLFPAPWLRLANRLLVRFGYPPTRFGMNSAQAVGLFLGYVSGWLLYGVAFWCFLRAVGDASAPNLVVAVGLYNGAYQVGYLALFAPGGLGPRELVMAALLTPYVGGIAAALAVLARLWAIVVEVIAALLALAVPQKAENNRAKANRDASL